MPFHFHSLLFERQVTASQDHGVLGGIGASLTHQFPYPAVYRIGKGFVEQAGKIGGQSVGVVVEFQSLCVPFYSMVRFHQSQFDAAADINLFFAVQRSQGVAQLVICNRYKEVEQGSFTGLKAFGMHNQEQQRVGGGVKDDLAGKSGMSALENGLQARRGQGQKAFGGAWIAVQKRAVKQEQFINVYHGTTFCCGRVGTNGLRQMD